MKNSGQDSQVMDKAVMLCLRCPIEVHPISRDPSEILRGDPCPPGLIRQVVK